MKINDRFTTKYEIQLGDIDRFNLLQFRWAVPVQHQDLGVGRKVIVGVIFVCIYQLCLKALKKIEAQKIFT